MKIISWIMLILGVVFVMTSISIFFRSKKVRANCTKKVVATVVDIKQEDLNQTLTNNGEPNFKLIILYMNIQ